MPQNSIRPEGIDILLKSISGCAGLVELDLQDNTFTNVGSKACAKYLSGWPNLSILNVGECLLGKQGSRDILEALVGSHVELKELLLSYNEMDVDGLKLIPSVLKGKLNLDKLELNGNAFEAESDEVDAVRDALREMGRVDALDELDDMEVSSDEEEEEGSDEDEENKEVKKDKEVDALADMMGAL
jgi:Ran GTPase-activating protein 1